MRTSNLWLMDYVSTSQLEKKKQGATSILKMRNKADIAILRSGSHPNLCGQSNTSRLYMLISGEKDLEVKEDSENSTFLGVFEI
jgi:hypothetical protein